MVGLSDQEFFFFRKEFRINLHHKAIELGSPQHKSPFNINRVLSRHDKKRLFEGVGRFAYGNLLFSHGLKESRAGLFMRPIDLIGEDEISEKGTGMEL